MKKVFLALCFALISVTSFAQSGSKAIGGHLIYGDKIESIGIGVVGQYNITDPIRVEASFDYFLENDGFNMWDINANVHYLFPINPQWTAYPLAGLGLKHISADHGGSDSELHLNFGGGIQYQLNNDWKLNFELKYQAIGDWDQIIFGLGAMYSF